jgi:hypothetical protein
MSNELIVIQKSFHSNGWPEYAPADQAALGSWQLASGPSSSMRSVTRKASLNKNQCEEIIWTADEGRAWNTMQLLIAKC